MKEDSRVSSSQVWRAFRSDGIESSPSVTEEAYVGVCEQLARRDGSSPKEERCARQNFPLPRHGSHIHVRIAKYPILNQPRVRQRKPDEHELDIPDRICERFGR